MRWQKVTFSKEEFSAGKQFDLQKAFDAVFVAFGSPKDAGMFRHQDPLIRDYYFSPGAVRVAMPLIATYSCTETGAPAKSEVIALVAHAGADDIPFSSDR